MSWDRKVRDSKKNREVEFGERKVNKKPKKVYSIDEDDNELATLANKFSNFDFSRR